MSGSWWRRRCSGWTPVLPNLGGKQHWPGSCTAEILPEDALYPLGAISVLQLPPMLLAGPADFGSWIVADTSAPSTAAGLWHCQTERACSMLLAAATVASANTIILGARHCYLKGPHHHPSAAVANHSPTDCTQYTSTSTAFLLQEGGPSSGDIFPRFTGPAACDSVPTLGLSREPPDLPHSLQSPGSLHRVKALPPALLLPEFPTKPPKAQWPQSGPKRGPATPAPKQATWPDPDQETSCSTPPLGGQAAADTRRSPSLDSLVGKADLGGNPGGQHRLAVLHVTSSYQGRL